MVGYWLFDRWTNRAYCFVWDKEQAETIAEKNNCEVVEIWVED